MPIDRKYIARSPRRIFEIMKKRILALVLCFIMILPMAVSCSKEPVKSEMQMYFSQQIYDFDPLNAFNNDAQAKIVSLIFAGLYKVNENGKVERDLVKKEEIVNNSDRNEYTVKLYLNDTCWSDGSAVQASDVLYTFQRVLKAQGSSDAAALLYQIKNAREVKNGDVSKDDLGVLAVGTKEIHIQFTHEISKEDLEQLKLNLSSPALFPVREMNVEGKPDWAKKQSSMSFSGPFIIRKVSYTNGNKQLLLERNSYYYRNREKDAEDKYVTPYRIYVDFEYSPEDQIIMYENGQVLYVSDIPLSLRSQYKEKADIIDTLSTHTYYFNQNALIKSAKAGEEEGFKLFAVKEVRQALSLAINRQTIAEAVVFGTPATGLVSNKVFSTTYAKKTFREKVGALASLSSADATAKIASLIETAGINPSDYTFSISVRAGDEDHVAIANIVCEAWCALGFNVTVNPVGIKVNEDKDPVTKEDAKDIRDDIYEEDCVIGGNYEILAIDLVAKSPSAFSVLAPFAIDFTGNLTIDGRDIVEIPHSTGYTSEEYNELITKAFKATNAADKEEYLKQAEKLLVEDDAVVAPILFNQVGVLQNKKLTKLEESYYGFHYFTDAKLKNWEEYRDIYFPSETEAPEEEAPVEDPAGGAA